jgi:hypothetical protein
MDFLSKLIQYGAPVGRGCEHDPTCRGVMLTHIPSVHATLLAEGEGAHHLLGSGVPLPLPSSRDVPRLHAALFTQPLCTCMGGQGERVRGAHSHGVPLA